MLTTAAFPAPSSPRLDILSDAVRLASDRKILTVAALRADLLALYPGCEGAIRDALMQWARHEVSKRLH